MLSMFVRRVVSRATTPVISRVASSHASTRPTWSRSFITTIPRLEPPAAAAATKAKTKTTPTKTAKKPVKKPVGRPKTPVRAQKPKLKYSKNMLPPKKGWSAYFHFLHDYRVKNGSNPRDLQSNAALVKVAAEAWKALSYEEKQRYEEIAAKGREEASARIKEYWDTVSPEVVKLLKTHANVKDHRPHARKSATPFIRFYSEWYHREGKAQHTDVKEATKAASSLWKAMTEEEKKPYHDAYVQAIEARKTGTV